jgi:hypothetical protein
VKRQAQQFTTAAEDTADGITLKFTIAQPAGLDRVSKALLPGGQTAGVADAIRRGGEADVRVEVNAGYKCD